MTEDGTVVDGPDDYRLVRRRLVRGSFAVPTVLTVLSGRALAMTTAEQKSLGRDLSQHLQPIAVSDPRPSTDTWVRVRAYKGQGTGNAEFVPASRLPQGAIGSNAPFISGTQALCVVSGGSYSVGQIVPSAPGINSDTNWHAVLFDSTGGVAGIANAFPASRTALGAVHQSVWSSFIV